ncbi:unnamed protein product [Aureobasidium vineae]|uniref:Uncharacterized protein n=1 Tax=Aureobasidium vineae TaxID=2773715 RepID=A0A9N8J791_9PEZI|nr:unnamed protein product [Aureobasidium vineae]
MATEASRPLTNGTGPESKLTEPIQFSMPLPNAPGSRIHTHLTILATSILIFCTSTTAEFSSSAIPSLGSFVYAMPDVGSSVNFSSAGNGGSVEEEMEAFRQLVAVVLKEVEKARAG